MCVLRVYGPDFDPEAYLAGGSRLDPLEVLVPGNAVYDRRRQSGRGEERGVHVGVSDRPWSDWEGQVRDATVFLRVHRDELRALQDRPEVTTRQLDVPAESDVDERHVTAWGGRLPAEFLEAAGEAGVDVHVTVYFATPERGKAARAGDSA